MLEPSKNQDYIPTHFYRKKTQKMAKCAKVFLMIYAPTNSAQPLFVLQKWQIWLILDIILKDMKTLILYWRTWKPWYYIEGHENPLNLIENAFFLANNREKLSSMLFKRRIIFYSFQLSFLHCSLFLFNFFLGIFIRGRIILHSWKFTFCGNEPLIFLLCPVLVE